MTKMVQVCLITNIDYGCSQLKAPLKAMKFWDTN